MRDMSAQRFRHPGDEGGVLDRGARRCAGNAAGGGAGQRGVQLECRDRVLRRRIECRRRGGDRRAATAPQRRLSMIAAP